MNTENDEAEGLRKHVRLGQKGMSALVPDERVSEARAVLYAASLRPRPFAQLESFDTGTLNPFFSA